MARTIPPDEPRRGHPTLRIVVGLVIAIGLAVTAMWATNRADRLAVSDIVGLYRVEPASREAATSQLLFQRFMPDGAVRFESIHLQDGPSGLSAEVRVDSARVQSWTLEDDQLCLATATKPACRRIARDPLTGDLTIGTQRLTRIRGSLGTGHR